MSYPIHRISRLGIVNCYLVPESEGLTLIDTCLKGTSRAILRRARTLDQSIVRVVLTHAHSDHIGSLDRLARALPDVEVIVGEREEPLMRGDKTLRAGEPDNHVRGQYPGAVTAATAAVSDGDSIGSLTVIATPGHSPGHIALFDTRDGTVYGGDVFTTKGGVATSAVVNPRFPMAGMLTWDRGLELDSARRLLDLAPDRLAPGHGMPVDSPREAMQRAIEVAARRTRTWAR